MILTHLVMLFFEGATETAPPPAPAGDSGLSFGIGLTLGTQTGTP